MNGLVVDRVIINIEKRRKEKSDKKADELVA